MTDEQQKAIADALIAAGVPVGAAIAIIPGGAVVGAVVTAVLVGGGKIWQLCLDPDQPLVDLSGEAAKQAALDAAAVAAREAREAAKFGITPAPLPAVVSIDGAAVPVEALLAPNPEADDFYAAIEAEHGTDR